MSIALSVNSHRHKGPCSSRSRGGVSVLVDSTDRLAALLIDVGGHVIDGALVSGGKARRLTNSGSARTRSISSSASAALAMPRPWNAGRTIQPVSWIVLPRCSSAPRAQRVAALIFERKDRGGLWTAGSREAELRVGGQPAEDDGVYLIRSGQSHF